MINKIYSTLLLILAITIVGCDRPDPNITSEGQDELELLQVEQPINNSKMEYNDIVYVPIYSDIYVNQFKQKQLLAATLSIRNSSSTDSLFISEITYYNTKGIKVRDFISKPIGLAPMASINYVIEKDDDTGGHGANFIVHLSSRNPALKPIIQAVMIGEIGNNAFAFLTDGYSIP